MNFPIVPPGDYFDKAPITKGDVQIFVANQNNQNWQTWTKPRGTTMVHMVAIAGGGGGGAGAYRTGSGGGGGACSGTARLTTPAWTLPDVLYVQVGVGGLGGVYTPSTSSLTGSAGSNSYVSLGHNITLPSVILASGANAPGGGGSGSVATAGVAGTVPTIATSVTNHVFGSWNAIVGIIGAVGGAATPGAGTSITAWPSLPMSPGAGGGGASGTTSSPGGGQQATAVTDIGFMNWTNVAGQLVQSGSQNGWANGGSLDGGNGIVMWQPFLMTGGSGGAGNPSGSGGNGGNGGIGCGGGGGGAGLTPGRGGYGGNGMVLITSW